MGYGVRGVGALARGVGPSRGMRLEGLARAIGASGMLERFRVRA